MKKTVINDIVQFAIQNEQKAADLYDTYSKIVEPNSSRDLLKALAHTERSHEKRLTELYKNKAAADLNESAEIDLEQFKIYTTIDEESSIYEVFNFAIESEQKAHELYTALSETSIHPETQIFFSALATDEAQHRIDLQNEYQKEFRSEFDY